MRVTKESLREQCVQLNKLLGRPEGLMDIGHITVDSNGCGYQLEEELNGMGAVFAHTDRITAREMHFMLQGMIKGVVTQSRNR